MTYDTQPRQSYSPALNELQNPPYDPMASQQEPHATQSSHPYAPERPQVTNSVYASRSFHPTASMPDPAHYMSYPSNQAPRHIQPAGTNGDNFVQQRGEPSPTRPNPYYGGELDSGRRHSSTGSYNSRRSSSSSSYDDANGRRDSKHSQSDRRSSNASRSGKSSQSRKTEENPRVYQGSKTPTWGDSLYSLVGYLRKRF